MNKYCDLHTHSTYSDGTFSPAEIIDAASKLNLSAVALCDHNNINGLNEFVGASEGKNIEAVPGIEFSVTFDTKKVHLLALFIEKKYYSDINDFLADANIKKENSNIELTEKLNKAGYLIDYSEIKRKTPNGFINRANIAAELTEKGYTESTEHAFKTLLSEKAGFYIPAERLNLFDTLEFIKDIGAVSILAHPLLNLSEKELVERLPSALSHGLDAIECYHSKYDTLMTESSLSIAKHFNLAVSGGSDFHGSNKPDVKLGTGNDNLKIPADILDLLKLRIKT